MVAVLVNAMANNFLRRFASNVEAAKNLLSAFADAQHENSTCQNCAYAPIYCGRGVYLPQKTCCLNMCGVFLQPR